MNFYLLTGTTKGLGLALRDQLLTNANNRVVTLSRAADSAQPFVNVFADLSKPDSVSAAFQMVLPQLAGQVFERAVLINNAGVVLPVGRFESVDADALTINLSVNLLAPMLLTALFANATRGCAAHRRVVNISSGAAKRPIAGWSAYCAAKAGLEMATRVAALEAQTNDPSFAICSLAPGVIDTPMQGQVREQSADQFPDVERFRGMKADGTLRAATDVARDIVDLIDRDRFANGGVYDLRELK